MTSATLTSYRTLLMRTVTGLSTATSFPPLAPVCVPTEIRSVAYSWYNCLSDLIISFYNLFHHIFLPIAIQSFPLIYMIRTITMTLIFAKNKRLILEMFETVKLLVRLFIRRYVNKIKNIIHEYLRDCWFILFLNVDKASRTCYVSHSDWKKNIMVPYMIKCSSIPVL